MVYRDITQLAVYQINEDVDTVPKMYLRDIYLKTTSEIIYLLRKGMLFGIVCIKEALQSSQLGEVRINKSFTALKGCNIMKAHEVFQQNSRINKIPVVNERGELIGDYSRWDDGLYIKRNHERLMTRENVEGILKLYEPIYIIVPNDRNDMEYLRLIEYLNRYSIGYSILNKEQFPDRLSENAIYIFLNEDEKRGFQSLYGLQACVCSNYEQNMFRYDMSEERSCKIKLVTYKNVLLQIENEMQNQRLGLGKNIDFSGNKFDIKASILLSALQQKGIKCFCLYETENELREYKIFFENEVRERLLTYTLLKEGRMWQEDEQRKEFYDELYERDDYEKGIAQKEIYEAVYSFGYKRNIAGKYFNAINGIRTTCFQPKEYEGTIYLLGLCPIVGLYVEDQYTIASWMQKKLLEKGYRYRVQNYGSMVHLDADIDERLKEIDKWQSGDIVIYLSRIGKAVGIQGGSFEQIFEKFQIPAKWVTDTYGHCNHKVNRFVADGMLEMVEPYLSNNLKKERSAQCNQPNIFEVMKNYIKSNYLDQYFTSFYCKKYRTIGAIVMNCNPFTKGHRYLIEYAKNRVEFLIIFAVEEDESIFPFEERYYLIREGIKDLTNVMVVPSGDFILSKNNFREYFSKQEDEMTIMNAEYDVRVFADYIAKPLHITHRFAGEEPVDRITKIYNETMKRILPQKEIIFEEIPRIRTDNVIISASEVRKYIQKKEYSKAFAMLPTSTIKYFKEQIYLGEEMRE